MQTGPDTDGHIRCMPHPEVACVAKDLQSHVGNLSSVPISIAPREPRCHHVGIPYGFHLQTTTSCWDSLSRNQTYTQPINSSHPTTSRSHTFCSSDRLLGPGTDERCELQVASVCKAGDRSALSLIADPGSSIREVTQPARPPSEEDSYQGQSGVLTIGFQGYWKESGFKGSL